MQEPSFAASTSMSTGTSNAAEYYHWSDPSLIKLRVAYPVDHEGEKHLQEGIAWVSRETADILIGKGIAIEEERTAEEMAPVEAAQSPIVGTQSTSTVTFEGDPGNVAAEAAAGDAPVVSQPRPKKK